jgi:hypothetical protein
MVRYETMSVGYVVLIYMVKGASFSLTRIFAFLVEGTPCGRGYGDVTPILIRARALGPHGGWNWVEVRRLYGRLRGFERQLPKMLAIDWAIFSGY